MSDQCKYGHSLEDAYVHNGKRHCRVCKRLRLRVAREKAGALPRDPQKRFLKLVLVPSQEDGCMEWQGSTNDRGYGQLRVGYRQHMAHRFSYEMFVGPIADGLVIDHICRNPRCVRPDHLEAVHQAENIRRGLQGVLKTHCKRGHPYTLENTKLDVRGNRFCVLCRREYWGKS